MDLQYFLETRLIFIAHLYDSATAPFEETKRKIDNGEEPYVDTRDPEWADGPAFLSEWQEADNAAAVIGHWCLCMVQASLQAYLKESISPLGSTYWDSEGLVSALPQKQGGNWFGRYSLLFREELKIDFNAGPVPLSDLEQLNLTRDDLIHNVSLLTEIVSRTEKHAQRYPIALFPDDLWTALGTERIRVTKEKLDTATRLVRDFCAWLDGIRCSYPQWLHDRRNDAVT